MVGDCAADEGDMPLEVEGGCDTERYAGRFDGRGTHTAPGRDGLDVLR